jgi:hypothetical protein
MASSETASSDPRLLVLASGDNIAVARQEIAAGSRLLVAGQAILLGRDLGFGHKLAVAPIPAGTKVIKYGAPIGSATADIAIGDYVHHHNVASDYLPNTVAAEVTA